MNYVPDDPTDEWKLSIELWMIRTALSSADPEADIKEWLDEAQEGDEVEFQWAVWTWDEIRTWSSYQLERRQRLVEPQLATLRRLRYSH